MPDLPIRVAVISRNQLIRAGLVSLIAQMHDRAIITEAASVDRHLEFHDVAVYDIGAVEDTSAYTDLQRLLDTKTQVIGLVYDPMRDTVPEAAGATAHVITLSVTPEQLWEVLQRTTAPRQQHHGDPESLQLPAGLVEREFQVIELIGAGLSNRQIAKELFVSDNTVKTYVRTAYRKIGVTDRAGAMLWALEHGIAGGPERR
jgi:DNA-binding NarL/FixJ family response regulator